ncbi:hypothetical protein [Planomonospora venezuelensis]|uniref:Uncharacterized protein n=1 Tax=Planomonospora venezuelensis TaxID=1999 RepID=A0A841D560_PLAVE|nr:hypothetical protein [Planomonospora venezuelensis]MBB5963634.1 hypothetical protein [Planomonospora venezuelensis]
MIEAQEVSNPDLKERHGISLDGQNRLSLNKLKLVDSRKQGRAYAHILTDAGWAYLARELRARTLPMPRKGAGSAVHRALLAWLPGFLERTDQPLADVFQPYDGSVPGSSEAASTDSPAASPAPSASVPASVNVETRIRLAYAELAAKPGAWVSLAKIRPLLGDTERAEVDDTLRRMNRMPDVRVVPEENQKTLTPADREAAVVIGDQDKHFLAIGA